VCGATRGCVRASERNGWVGVAAGSVRRQHSSGWGPPTSRRRTWCVRAWCRRCSMHHLLPTGAGGDNGIADIWNRREISASCDDDRSHDLHPHPYSRQLVISAAGRRRPLIIARFGCASLAGGAEVGPSPGARGERRVPPLRGGAERSAALHHDVRVRRGAPPRLPCPWGGS
jgi:hypothetical protein